MHTVRQTPHLADDTPGSRVVGFVGGPVGDGYEPDAGIHPLPPRGPSLLLLDGTPLTRECLTISLHGQVRGIRVRSAESRELPGILARGESYDAAILNVSGFDGGADALGALLTGVTGTLGTIPLLVLSDREDMDTIRFGFGLGIRGYLTTNLRLSVAAQAIQLVAAGGCYVPDNSLSALMGNPPRPLRERTNGLPEARRPDGVHADPAGELTPRERDVLECLREGKANKTIAHELGMSESTVKVHVRNILKKMGASNRTQAVCITYLGQ